jgi:hypothetical protein
MAYYPVDVDIDPEQAVRWLLVERQKSGAGVETRAWRVNEKHPIVAGVEQRLGDEELEDINDEVTVARLEISPAHAEGWRIVISAEAEIEPVTPEEDSTEDEEEPIDLDSFYGDFVRSPRTTTTISAEAESAEAQAELERLIHGIETDTHVPEGRSAEARGVG